MPTCTRLAIAVAAALACLVGVSACDANPAPAPLPSESASPSSSTSASPSPTAAPPTMPAAAKGTGEKAAKAFVRYWIDTLNYAGPSGQTSQLRRISGDQCAACGAIIELIEEVYAADGYIRGEGWRVDSVKVLSSGNQGEVVVEAQVNVSPQRILQEPGAKVVQFDGGDRLKTFWLNERAGRWHVTRLDQPE